MLFGKPTRKTETKMESRPRLEPYDIHVMPVKFHKFLAMKKGGLGKLVLILAIIILALAGVAFGAYYFIGQTQKAPAPAANYNLAPTVNLNQNLNQANQNVNIPANENLNANLNLNQNQNINANANVNQNANLNANLNTNLNVPAATAVNYTSSLDSDSDGLTDVEEDLYGTEKRNADTDGDGFSDGQEIINLFNPKVAGAALLETSGLVNIYSNPTYNYRIFYLSSWLARSTDQSLKEVIFQSATGEYVQVLIEDNPQQLDLVQWYLAQSPGSDLNQLEKKTTKQGYEALVSPDKLTDYLKVNEAPDKVFIIAYNIGDKTQVNFLTTFATMINSFKLTAQPSSTAGTPGA